MWPRTELGIHTFGLTVAAYSVTVEGETTRQQTRRCAAWIPQKAAVSLETRRKAGRDLPFRKLSLHIGMRLKQAGFKVCCGLCAQCPPRGPCVVVGPRVMVLGNTVGFLVPHGSGGIELRLGSRHFHSLNHVPGPLCGPIFLLLLRLYII